MCTADDFFMSTDQSYLYALHILTLFEIPIHFFGAFIVLAKTPTKMSSVKFSMLVLHSVGAFYDIYMSFIASPVFTIPACAGYPLGLSVFLGIPTDLQVYLGFAIGATVCVSILGFFEDRYYVLKNGQGQRRTWKRRAYLASHYLLAFVFILPGFMSIPSKTEGQFAVVQKIPCVPRDVFTREGFFVLTTDSTVCLICFSLFAVLMTSQLMFFAISITWSLTHSVSKSKTITRMQKQFMIALSIQVIIPVTVICLPACYIIFSVWTEYYNQAAANTALVMVSMHGVASTITMLIVHRPYRDATLTLFHLKPERKSSIGGPLKIWLTTGE